MTAPSIMVTNPMISGDISNNYGGIYTDNGSITTNGSGLLTVGTMAVNANITSAITCTIGSTIAVSGARVILGIPSGAAAATNLTLATGVQGQELTIINSNSTGANTLVFTGNVVANVTISGATAAKLVFNTTLASWTKA
jgi:hypothetical protein